MKKLLLGLLIAFSLGANAQQGNSPYSTSNATTYSGVNPRFYISGVQGSVRGENLNYAFVAPTFTAKTDTVKLFPGAWNTVLIPSDSLGNYVASDTQVVVGIKSNYGGPAGSFPGDIIRFQIQACNLTASHKATINFRNKWGSYFVWTTGADSTTALGSKQCLYLEIMNTDGTHWLEKSRIVK